ncbi:MAG: hypothetical protein ABSF44_08560 [Candidatus Bathyarchaeia archaeon]
MKNARKLVFIFSVFASFFLLFGYPFFRISYALYFEPNSGPPDIISMLPWSYWLFTALILALVIIQILFAQSKFEIKLEKLFLTIFVPWMMYASLPISQFPSIYTINDAVVHLAYAENIILNAGVHLPATGYLQFPGTFYMVAIIGNLIGVTGGASLLELGIILNTIFVLLISLFLLVIGQRILGSRNGFILPILYFLVNTDFFTQFCPQNFALVLYFMGIFVFLFLGESSIKSRYATYLLVLISAIISMTHPITSVFMIATFFGVYLGQKLFKRKIGVTISIQFLLFIVGILIAWWIFFATENFEALINSFSSLLQAGIHSPTSLLLQPLSTFSSKSLSLFTKGFQFFMAGAAVVGLIFIWFRRKTKAIPLVLFEFLIGLLIVSVFPIFLFNGLWADRPFQFLYFPICALAIFGLEGVSVISKKIRFTKHLRTLGICLLIIILPLAFIYHHQLDSTEKVLSSDFSTSRFLLKFTPLAVPIAFPWTIGGYATYFYQDPAIANIQIAHPSSTLTSPYIFIAWLNNPQVLVFSIKEIRYFEYTGTISSDYEQRISYLNESTAWDRVYDNRFNTVYVSSSLTNATGASG